jgi:hypothetical protein
MTVYLEETMSNGTEYQLTREMEGVGVNCSWTQLFLIALDIFKST